jgi:hypothetical protein
MLQCNITENVIENKRDTTNSGQIPSYLPELLQLSLFQYQKSYFAQSTIPQYEIRQHTRRRAKKQSR